MEGPDALAAVLGQLEGFEAPAGAWETEILPARIAGYDPVWLDDQCLAGRIAWARLRPRSSVGERGAGSSARGGRQRRVCRAGADDADYLARAPARAAMDRAVADTRSGAGQPPRPRRRRFHPRRRRLVFRRAGRRHEAAAPANRGGAGRAGGAGAGQLGQFRRAARVADAGRQARAPAARPGAVRDGGFRPLGPGAPRPPGSPDIRKRR